MNKPKLIFLCQTLPYPPDGGVSIRSYNILRLLSEQYDVSALFFYRRSAARDIDASVAALQQLAVSVDVFPIEQEHSRRRLLADHVRSVASGRVYTTAAYENAAFRRRLAALVRSIRFDLAHVDSLDLSPYLPVLAGIPVVCVHHNVESVLLRRRAAAEPKRLARAYLRLQSVLMEREERRWCPRVALNVAVSTADRADLQRLAPHAKVTVVPNGVDVAKFMPRSSNGSGMVFVGGMTWFPNRDALEYFSVDILPRLRAAGCSDAVTWVGRALPGAAAEHASKGIQLTGYVEDVRPYVAAAACYIVPLRVGGGTRLKILDAWAMGKAIVSTSVGCEGLDARDGWNIIIRDDPDEFAAAVRNVLSDHDLRTALGANARETVERLYSWNVIAKAMYADYESVRIGATPNAPNAPTVTAA